MISLYSSSLVCSRCFCGIRVDQKFSLASIGRTGGFVVSCTNGFPRKLKAASPRRAVWNELKKVSENLQHFRIFCHHCTILTQLAKLEFVRTRKRVKHEEEFLVVWWVRKFLLPQTNAWNFSWYLCTWDWPSTLLYPVSFLSGWWDRVQSLYYRVYYGVVTPTADCKYKWAHSDNFFTKKRMSIWIQGNTHNW